jgi:hypothetical protein
VNHILHIVGGMYGGASVIKSRLLPFLGSTFFTSGTTSDVSLGVIAEATAKNREIDDLQDMYEDSLRDIEGDLRAKELENQDLRDEYVMFFLFVFYRNLFQDL